MSAKQKSKQKPEDMLLRIIHVAEILARGESESPEPTTIRDKPTIQATEHPSLAVQKTQM
ncbi:hypothetical protein G4Y79_01245 [Phototrophicus methaneseepsis]|uniref:Uncharacterized protein n=1 Tax=Phototrophicus methaneseepsis TaxID=2710758 RepID=A0A7S8EA21_9CHLR|nr:hypothetical protein [Phototrophicus methaneseepsis]QPC83029.1 hypothetical protein G4Y79_01245 [Phototrophicus methaneseepsis]